MEQVKRAFSSPRAFHQAIRLKSSSSFLINEDLLPSPASRQTWTTWSFFAYWWSESWNVSTWSIGSSLISAGASVRNALLVVFFANLLSATVMVLNGFASSRYHIGYPVLSRVSFGIYGHYFVVVLRSILGIIWGGVQMYFEGQFISICLRCIFPGWSRIPNNIPDSQHITTQTMVGFFLAFLFTVPFVFVHTSRIQPVFTVKSVVVPLAGLGIVIWATKANGGVGASSLDAQAESAKTSTKAFAWAIVSQFNAVMGSNSALLVTIPDIARYSKTRSAQTWGQLIALPVGQTLCASFGVISTSAVLNMYGESFWNPYDLLNGILDHGYTSPARAGVFFAAASFAFATLGTSIACNFIPFAADVTCLLPKYLNIVRGQFLCLILAFAIAPWRIVTSAAGFLNFLNGYSIFQGPVVAIMIVDYFLLRRGNLAIADMYTTSPSGVYYYLHGANGRAFAAFVIGFLLPLPGFIESFGSSSSLNEAASNMYALGWELSFLVGGAAYLVFGLVWPMPGDWRSMGFEQAPVHDEAFERSVVLEATGVDASGSLDDEGGKLEDKSHGTYSQGSHV
ncbi:nucleobase cation symporter-1 family protein [Aspergillus lucknowensis]|uniref:Permease for cytosine/purines, uracil, thiamine, allantoin-domain-containing protein n=1 Tax=Aspergillus lucknowensis TaxID=176173 RepID=A0ABR4M6V1_9EURO